MNFPNPEVGTQLYRENFTEQPEDVTMNPESIDLLVNLTKRNIRVGIVTNRKRGKWLVEKLPFPVLFDIIIDLSSGIQPKPSPEGIILAINQLNVAPEEVLFIGDTYYDIEAGKSAGVKFAGYTKGIHNRNTLSVFSLDWIIDSLSEILTIL